MSTRHSNKKLQRAIRSRMEATGQRYQEARAAVLRALGSPPRGARPAEPHIVETEVDLIQTRWLGRPVAIAVVGGAGGAGLAAYLCGVSPAGPLPIPLHARAGLRGKVWAR